MNIKIVGKELKATDAIKEYIGKKSERLIKYFGEEFDVTATIKTEGGNKAEATELFSFATKKVDQACTKGVIVKNTAARKNLEGEIFMITYSKT